MIEKDSRNHVHTRGPKTCSQFARTVPSHHMLASRPIRPYSASHAFRVRLLSLKRPPNYHKKRRSGDRAMRNGPECPERVHFVERVLLAVFYNTRSEVLDCRLIRANEHQMCRQHSHSEYREKS